MAKYRNSWTNHPTFVDLGVVYSRGLHYDLYACLRTDKSVSFGGKWSDADPDYCSGEAFREPRGWHITGGEVVHTAAARYFANHHFQKAVNGYVVTNRAPTNTWREAKDTALQLAQVDPDCHYHIARVTHTVISQTPPPAPREIVWS